MLRQEVTATQTTEIELAPEIVAHMEVCLQRRAQIEAEIEKLESEHDTLDASMQTVMEASGFEKLQIGESKIAIVRGTSSSLDKKKLIAQGVTPAMIEMATTRKPKRAYLSVRKAGEKEEGTERGED